MELFHIGKGLTSLVEKPFKLEKELQDLFEQNLESLTGLEFVKSEFAIQNQRLDTLAYNLETKSFVIIEYKRATNVSVLDQGVSYLNTLLKYKADFVLEYQEQTGKALTKKEVDWSQSKVIFVSPNFTDFQKQAVDFKDLNIELCEVNRYDQDILVVSGISKSQNAPSIKTKTESARTERLTMLSEIVTYDEEYHLLGKSDAILECYQDVKNALFQLEPTLHLEAKKLYLSFKKHKKNIVDIQVQKNQLKLFINAKWGELEEFKGLARNVSQIGTWGNGDYQFIIKDTRHLEYIMSLVKQVLGI
ncbi:DUF5655 domain-containing protein [Streptococcus sp. sy010]|uniref:DUF5655 domain-containing protein n=1 Tax=Streptococcus sp. sy010 TaxID=2600148 RepID=UPI0011B55F85|nr:DUF5655 domain-containing protein [Streptococcus sp. sy010]TWT16353.1 hypothetical protein FRX51_00115 [Streptococcus sp. sy010]